MLIFCRFLKLPFSGLKNILFYPVYQKTIFSGLICPRHTWQKVRFFDKNHGLTLLENFEFLDFFKSFFFWCRKDFFIQNNKKTIFSCLICPKYIDDKKSDFFYESHGLTPLENFDFVDFFKTFFFRSRKHSFLSRRPKNDLLWLDCTKKHRW